MNNKIDAQLSFPVRNFMVEVSQHKTIEPSKFYPEGDYPFSSGWLSQKHPYGYRVEYFSTREDACKAIENYEKENPDKPGSWKTFIIYALFDVTSKEEKIYPITEGELREIIAMDHIPHNPSSKEIDEANTKILGKILSRRT